MILESSRAFQLQQDCVRNLQISQQNLLLRFLGISRRRQALHKPLSVRIIIEMDMIVPWSFNLLFQSFGTTYANIRSSYFSGSFHCFCVYSFSLFYVFVSILKSHSGWFRLIFRAIAESLVISLSAQQGVNVRMIYTCKCNTISPTTLFSCSKYFLFRCYPIL